MLLDYYALLGVPSSATLEEIKRAYRQLARQHHPDVTRMAEDVHMKQLNEAYKILSDPLSRTRYDIQRLEEQRIQTLREAWLLQRSLLLRQQTMSWRDGMRGFVRELQKGLRDEQ